MVVNVRVRVGSDEVMRTLRGGRVLDPATMRQILERVGTLAVRSIQRGIRRQISPDGRPYKGVNRFGRGGKRIRDTGVLLKSITYRVTGSRVTVGTNLTYAAMQHYGGTQRPRRAKMLAIPLTRRVARAAATAGGFRAAFPNAFAFRSAGGNVLLARRKAAGKLHLLAVLKASVKIPATPFMGLSAEGERDILDFAERIIARRLGAQ